ncbi:hypothetical protein [Gardnerella vaginalis]|uniref:hypothetical protein n=1 Tax=Gardnerella vaginalis TaxID=2702 RepID=UPI0039EF3859
MIYTISHEILQVYADYAKSGGDSRFFAANEAYRSRGLAALTPSLALKAHCAFNLKQAQRSELLFRATL